MFGAGNLTDEVVCNAAAGAQEDLACVLEVLEPQVRLMIAARLSPKAGQFHAIDDIAQRVLVALTTGISRLKNRSTSGLKAFLSGIVARKVSDFIKGRDEGRAVLVAGSLDSTVSSFSHAGPLWQFLSATGATPRSAVEHAEQVATLMAELGRLKEEYRQVITFAFFDQLPMREVARRLRVSRPAASMLLVRAVRTLRRNMTGSSKVRQSHGNSS